MKKLSLRSVLLIYVVVPLATAMFVTGFFALTIWERQVQERMQADLEMVARAIQLPLSHSMERNREGGINHALESALSIDSVYSAYAYNLEGDQIASAGKNDPAPESRDKLKKMAEEGEKIGEYGQIAKRNVYSYFVPLKDSGNQASGLLQLTRREQDFQDYTDKIVRYGTVWFSVAILLMAGLVLVGQHQALGRHFRRMAAGMRKVAGGETNHRLPIAGPREIALIANSFNDMLDSIQRAEHEIQLRREEQKLLEEQLRQSEKLAAIGQLSAGVAHELGTPLSTISGTAQRNLREDPTGNDCHKEFARIQREVKRMEVIIRQLLDFSRRQKLQYRRIHPAKLAKSALDAVVGEDATRETRLNLSGEKDAAPFEADPVRIEQVLVNLIRNAFQSGPNINVELEWRQSGDSIVFAVADDGPGIPDTVKPHIFEPFFTTKNVGSGTGLGLAVAHGIVDEHGGKIIVGTSEMGGTRCEIWVPISAQGTTRE